MPPTLYRLLVIYYIYGHVAGDDFRPTPIPLDEWRPDKSRERAGTLHKTIKTASPPTVVALPAHYWEDALRHSVYLTLVRDEIDQLIAKGDVIAPNSTPIQHNYHEANDQDLWEKIKVAPFERLEEDEPTTYGDVTILARGRLLEVHGGFRFAEDDKSKEKCDNDACMNGVRAFWSVKRVRQRDQESSMGRYHYELTFSVMSQLPKKQKKPNEHPIRTFTVQENENKPLEPTKAYHRSLQGSRPERAIWFHKNIQTPQHRKRPQSGLDRLFSSWFDYDEEEPSYNLPRKYKQTSYHPSFSQYSKVGYAGGVSSEQHSQRALPYPYKSYVGKYNSHPLSTPPISNIHYHFESELGGINNPYISQTDYKASGLNNIHRTTRPAVLPTPLPPLPSMPKETYTEKNNSIKNDMFENHTNSPENASVHKQYNKMKTHMKVSPFPEQLRPPIYNAPPGIFVTMDKKPFKPMPPLKIPIAKPLRTNKPIDFRPSQQVLDVQFSEPDPLFDTVFRPITVNYFDSSTTEKATAAEDKDERVEGTIRNPTVTAKRPPKKHDNVIKTQRTTTATPDIITANNSPEQEDDMEWADILGIFTKTTPMEPQKEKSKISQTTTPLSTSSVSVTTTTKPTTTETPTTSASTTVKPKKRTRPPPKFNKAEKIKKHKRITSTTTIATTSTTTTTGAPSTAKITEEKKKKRLKQELTQQASKSATATTKPKWEPSSKTTSTTPFSTIGTTTTSYPSSTSKITTTAKAVEDQVSSTVRSKSANRFRQSTLMIKGTSVKHDRWTVTSPVPEKLRGQSAPSSFMQRRKGSNFHGYVSPTPKTLDETRNIHEHIDYGTSTFISSSPKSEESTIKNIELSSTITTASEETSVPLIDSTVESDNSQDKNQESYEESRDHNEYIFPQPSDTNNNKNNEISDNEDILTTENIVSTTPHSLIKTKKCKKKHQNLTIKDESKNTYESKGFTTTVTPSTTPLTTPNMLDDLLNDFPFEDSNSESSSTVLKQNLDKEQNPSHEQYFGVKDELEELLETLKNNDKYEELSNDEYEEEESEDEDDDNDDDDEDEEEEKEHLFEEDDTSFHSTNDSPHYSQKDYEDNENRPFTLLELMAME